MRGLILSILGATIAFGAGAATFDVNGTSLDTAVINANANPGHDIIILHDASYELTGSPTIITEEVTILTVGQAVTISKAAGTGGQVFRANHPSGIILVQGASLAAPITLLQNQVAVPAINSGPDTLATNSVHLENVVIERPAAGTASTGLFINFNNNGLEHSLTNVDFVGGDPANTGPVVSFGSNFGLTNVSLNDVDFSGADYNGPRITTSGTVLIAANCDLRRDLGDVLTINQAGVPFTGTSLTFTDCFFQSGAASVIDASLAPAAYTLIRPTVGPSGTGSFELATFSGAGLGSTISVKQIYTLLNDPLSDTDNDGMTDLWEVVGLLDPESSLSPNGPNDDPDTDFVTNLDEFLAGTNPNDDSDGPALPALGLAGLAALAAALVGGGVARQQRRLQA